MPKWKKGETEFTVSLGYNDAKGYWVTVPKPIVEMLGEPRKITFEVRADKRIEVLSASEFSEG